MNSTQIFKVCSKCGVEKPLTDFYKDKTSKNGYRYSCKKCSYTYNSKLKSSVGGHKICSKCNTEKPLSYFDKDTPPKTVNSLCNLQPLWAIDNLIKSNKF